MQSQGHFPCHRIRFFRGGKRSVSEKDRCLYAAVCRVRLAGACSDRLCQGLLQLIGRKSPKKSRSKPSCARRLLHRGVCGVSGFRKGCCQLPTGTDRRRFRGFPSVINGRACHVMCVMPTAMYQLNGSFGISSFGAQCLRLFHFLRS